MKGDSSMRKLVIASLFVSLAFLACGKTQEAPKTETAKSEEKTEEVVPVSEDTVPVMFVQTAQEISYSDGILSLIKVSPTTMFFSDRPERVVGHDLTAGIIGDYATGEDNFNEDPPNAVLSIFDDEDVTDVVVVLRNPVLTGDTLKYDIEVLDGVIPAVGGPSTLFIDQIGRPLSPVSVAGVHRRNKRRHRRHAVHSR
jgi:hypothetical protein